MTEQLREKIADTYRSFSFWQDKHRRSVSEFEAKFDECAVHILALTDSYYKEKYKNYVKMDSDQSLQTNPFTSRYMMNARYTDGFLHEGYEKAQQDMLKAGWRKVEVEDEG